MALKDPHDKREFRLFVKLAEDGSVLSTTQVATGAADPDDHDDAVFVEVTDLYPMAIDDVQVDKALVTQVKDAREAHREATLVLAEAQAAVAHAADVVTDKAGARENARAIAAEAFRINALNTQKKARG
jgi:hypothetical protein